LVISHWSLVIGHWGGAITPGRHAEFISAPHQKGSPHEVDLSCGFLKQVQDDLLLGALFVCLLSV